MIFRDIEIEFDILEAEDADAFDAALEKTRVAGKKVPGETLGNTIRRQCGAVFAFFDDLMGEGFHKQLFGERTNLMECLTAYREFIEVVMQRKAELEQMAGDALAHAPKVDSNRAARRAAAHTK